MTEQNWYSPADAAQRLHLSERTVWRRLRAGGLQSRLTADGRREVLVEALTGPDTTSDTTSDTVAAFGKQAERQIQLAAAAVGQGRELSLHLQADLQATRRSSRLAWSLVATLTIAAAAAAWWSTRTLTLEQARADQAQALLADTRARAQEQALDLKNRLADQAAEQTRLQSRLDQTQDRLEQARLLLVEAAAAQARAEAQADHLAAEIAAERISRPTPSTMPSDQEEQALGG